MNRSLLRKLCGRLKGATLWKLAFAVLLLCILWASLRGWEGKARYKGKTVDYWFSRYVRASGAPVEWGQEARHANVLSNCLEAIRALGTNAFPYLLSEAFATNQDSDLHRLVNQAFGYAPWSWHLSKLPDREEVSLDATEVLQRCKPPAEAVLPALVAPLAGTNIDQHLKALNILSASVGAPDKVAELLARDIGSQDQGIALTAVNCAQESPETARLVFFKMLPQLARSKVNRWQLQLINGATSEAAPAAPSLQSSFQSETNLDLRCELAETLVKIDPDYKANVMPALLNCFGNETNLDARIRLSESILRLDPEATGPRGFLAEAWENVTNTQQRVRVWSTLVYLAHTNLPSPIIPLYVLHYRPPPFERWLELGKGLETSQQGPSLAQWTALCRDGEPTEKARSLSEWLKSAAPGPSASLTFSNYLSLRRDCGKAVQAMGTNALPWLIWWLQSSEGDYLLAKRGMGMLKGTIGVVFPCLAELTQTNSPALRARAYGCLDCLNVDWPTIWPLLVPALHNPDIAIRSEAAAFLYRNFPEQAEQAGLRDFVSPATTQ